MYAWTPLMSPVPVLPKNDPVPAYKRRIAESEKKLDKSVDEQVEKTISQMPSRKRERLEGELRAGLDAEVVRTAPSTS